MVLGQKMTHPPISCEKSLEGSCWQVGTFTSIIDDDSKNVNKKRKRNALREAVMRVSHLYRITLRGKIGHDKGSDL